MCIQAEQTEARSLRNEKLSYPGLVENFFSCRRQVASVLSEMQSGCLHFLAVGNECPLSALISLNRQCTRNGFTKYGGYVALPLFPFCAFTLMHRWLRMPNELNALLGDY